MYKLTKKLYTRPLPKKVKDIGMWEFLLYLISVISIMSNITIIAL